jgi:hypothetical protein
MCNSNLIAKIDSQSPYGCVSSINFGLFLRLFCDTLRNLKSSSKVIGDIGKKYLFVYWVARTSLFREDPRIFVQAGF